MRCPFRMKGFDQPDTCDPECAWLIGDYPGGHNTRQCAMAVIAVSAANRDGIASQAMNWCDGEDDVLARIKEFGDWSVVDGEGNVIW